MSVHSKRSEKLETQRLKRRDDIRAWVCDKSDCLWIRSVEPWRSCRVVGVVERIRFDPAASSLEVTITDGNNELRGRWDIGRFGRGLLPAPGVGLILEGIPELDRSSHHVMNQPDFQIVLGPLA